MDAALALLAVRSRARSELDRSLLERGHPAHEREAVLARLEELGYLDDARFAKDLALGLLRRGGHGERAVLEKLAAHGISPEQAEVALASAKRELAFDPEVAARALLEKRRLLGATDRKLVARAARLLATRGFSSSVISRLLGAAVLDPPDEGG